MRSHDEQDDVSVSASYRELRLLSEVERDPDANQRELAVRLGSALGVTNYLLRSLAQKGYIRVSKAGWKRWFYAITPAGFARKISLTVTYIQQVLYTYREVRQTLREALNQLPLNAESRVAVYGVSDFAELVFLGLKEAGVDEIDFFRQSEVEESRFLGAAVRKISELRHDDYDLIMVAHLEGNTDTASHLMDVGVPEEKIVFFFTNVKGKKSKNPLKIVR